MALNLVVAGVGGQGSILASHIIAHAAIRYSERTGNAQNVRVGETFGAAMRGGSVASHVRIGRDVHGPLVEEDAADVVLAFEPLEGLRVGLEYSSPTGLVILNVTPVPPIDVKVGYSTYPAISQIQSALEDVASKVRTVDANALALKAGNLRTLNVVMLGALFATGLVPAEREDFIEAIRARVPSKALDANMRAFEIGLEEMGA